MRGTRGERCATLSFYVVVAIVVIVTEVTVHRVGVPAGLPEVLLLMQLLLLMLELCPQAVDLFRELLVLHILAAQVSLELLLLVAILAPLVLLLHHGGETALQNLIIVLNTAEALLRVHELLINLALRCGMIFLLLAGAHLGDVLEGLLDEALPLGLGVAPRQRLHDDVGDLLHVGLSVARVISGRR